MDDRRRGGPPNSARSFVSERNYNTSIIMLYKTIFLASVAVASADNDKATFVFVGAKSCSDSVLTV